MAQFVNKSSLQKRLAALTVTDDISNEDPDENSPVEEIKHKSVDLKKCSDCKEYKPVDKFDKKGMRYGKQAYQTKCKSCRSVYDKTRYDNDSSTILARNRTYYARNKEKIIQQHREYIAKNYNIIVERRKIYYEANKSMILEKHNEYIKRYYEEHPDKKLAQSCRRRARKVLLNLSNFDKLLGCDSAFLQEWLLFNISEEENYNVDNYGTYWHLDHVIPCAKWDLSDQEQIKQCFHWSNLAPLEAIENISKKDKLIDSYIVKQNEKLELFTSYKEITLIKLAKPTIAGST